MSSIKDRAIQLAKKGYGYRRIGEELTKEGFRTKSRGRIIKQGTAWRVLNSDRENINSLFYNINYGTKEESPEKKMNASEFQQDEKLELIKLISNANLSDETKMKIIRVIYE